MSKDTCVPCLCHKLNYKSLSCNVYVLCILLKFLGNYCNNIIYMYMYIAKLYMPYVYCLMSCDYWLCKLYFNIFVLFIQHGAAHVYPKLASLPVTHPLRKEAADVKVIFFYVPIDVCASGLVCCLDFALATNAHTSLALRVYCVSYCSISYS